MFKLCSLNLLLVIKKIFVWCQYDLPDNVTYMDFRSLKPSIRFLFNENADESNYRATAPAVEKNAKRIIGFSSCFLFSILIQICIFSA